MRPSQSLYYLVLIFLLGCSKTQESGLDHLVKYPLTPLPPHYGEPKIYSKIITDKRYIPEVDEWEWKYQYDFFDDEWEWRHVHIYKPEEFHLTYKIISQGDPGHKDISYSTNERVLKEYYNSVQVGDELVPSTKEAEITSGYEAP